MHWSDYPLFEAKYVTTKNFIFNLVVTFKIVI